LYSTCVKDPHRCLWVDTSQQLSRWLSFWLASGRWSVQNSVGTSAVLTDFLSFLSVLPGMFRSSTSY